MSAPDSLIDMDCGWDDEVWSWRPGNGRWTPEFGRPRRCVDIQLATARGGPSAYDFWRSTVFYNFEADPMDRGRAARFQARLHGLISQDIEFYTYTSAGLSGRRTSAHIDAGSSDEIDIGLVVTGGRHSRYDDGSVSSAGPGDFFVYDASRPCEISWQAHEALHISIKRGELGDSAGTGAVGYHHLEALLSASALAPFLRAQLLTLRDNVARLSDWEREVALSTVQMLVIQIVRSAQAGAGSAEQARDRLFNAASAFIQQHLAHPGLSAAMVAERLGASRATLYRAFARVGLTVAGHIREQRLIAMHARLRSAPPHIAIGDIAAECGLYDAPNVSRLFRARFGVPPSLARAPVRPRETNRRSV